MTQAFFPGIESIRYEGPSSENPLAFRYYDKDRLVLGKSVAEHLRCAVCYWHTFAWPGSDVFGAGTCEKHCTVTGPGQTIVGGVVSLTVIVWVHVAVLPQASTAW